MSDKALEQYIKDLEEYAKNYKPTKEEAVEMLISIGYLEEDGETVSAWYREGAVK